MSRPLTKNVLVDAGLDLLAALTSAQGHAIPLAQAQADLALDANQVASVVDTLAQLADSQSGCRACVALEDGVITLQGSAGEVAGIRLTRDEFLAAEQVIRRYQLDPEVIERFEKAMAPLGDARVEAPESGAADPLFGGFYQQISEALADGVRLRITYRSQHDRSARERLVDPGYFDVDNDAAFLVAWDVELDEQRRYRLDRISCVSGTEDSVCMHRFTRDTPHGSIGRTGQAVLLHFADASTFKSCDWAMKAECNPFGDDRCGEQDDGSVLACTACVSPEWLFDRILASGGSIRLVEPKEMRRQLLSYAAGLRM